MYFGAASRHACGRAFAAGARAGTPALGCICLRVRSPLRMHRCVYHVGAGVCAMRGDFLWLRPRSAPRPSMVARRARAAHARGARQVHRLHEGDGAPRVARPVQALGGTVRPTPPRRRLARSRRCRRCAAARGAAVPGRRAAPRGVGCGGGGVAGRRPRPSPAWHGWHARPTGAREGWAGAARRGRTVGAQGRGQHRARGAAGGGRVAEPEVPVSAAAAAIPRPGRCADAWAGALDGHHLIHMCVHMCVCRNACRCMHTYARMRRMQSSVGVGVCVRVCARRRPRERRAAPGGDLLLGITVHMYITTRARTYTCMRALVECISACVGLDIYRYIYRYIDI
jgi:hypothetical protein